VKVLIADGDPIFRAVLNKRMKIQRPSDEIWESEDGEQAVLLALAYHPDLVLMDIGLTRIDGLAATQLIKSKMPEVQVIVLSNGGGDSCEASARQSGADAFFAKSMCWSVLNRLQETSILDLCPEIHEEGARREAGGSREEPGESGESDDDLLWRALRNSWSD
jgi:DNA-binding NarL/FixJ family response regulator